MANYLYNRYNVSYGPWSGEQISYTQGSTGREFYGSWSSPSWDGNQYVGSGSSWMSAQSHWSYSNGYTRAYRSYWNFEGYIGEGSTTYSVTMYDRTRSASPTTLVQSNIVATIDQYPAHGVYSDGYYYIRTGIENSPIISSPNGGESVNELFTITYSDPKPKSDIRYHIQLSLNNGSTWKDIIPLTGYGVTSYQYNFKDEPPTSVAKVRVRAYDGFNYGAWDESNGVFTIMHNVAPTMPTNLSPSNILVDVTKAVRYSWKHNDNDAQSKVDMQWRVQGTTAWNTITSNGTEEFYYTTAILPLGRIEWRVRTYDTQGVVSPYSNVAVFTASEPSNTPIFTRPSADVNVARPIIGWIAPNQISYQLVISNSLNQTVYDTGEVVSSTDTITADFDFLNGATYTLRLRVKGASGIFSEYVTRTINVSYTPPSKPVIRTEKTHAYIDLIIENPPPTGTQPTVSSSEIYKEINGSWIRIATNVNFKYTDYAVASEENIKYRIRAFGENGTFTDSDVISIEAPKLISVYLHDVNDPVNTIHHFKFDGQDGKTEEFSREHAFRQFAGRTRPVIEYGTYTDYKREVTLNLVDDKIGRERLIQFMKNGSVILYRDARGRKFYTTLPEIGFTDLWYGNDVTLSLTEIDYIEGV